MKNILFILILLCSCTELLSQSMNKIRIGYGAMYYFKNSLFFYRSKTPLAYLVPNLQYERAFKYYPNYSLLFNFGLYHYIPSNDISTSNIVSGVSTFYGLGLSYQYLNKGNLKSNLGGGIVVRKGSISQQEFDPLFQLILTKDRNVNGYGLFIQHTIDYTIYKFIAGFCQLRYNHFFKNYNSSLVCDVGFKFSF